MSKLSRTEKFVGGKHGGGGHALADLFRPTLQYLVDNDSAIPADVVDLTRKRYAGGGEGARVKAMWGSWENCIDDVFAHLLDRELIVRGEDERYRRNWSGDYVVVFGPSKGRRQCKILILDAAARERASKRDYVHGEVSMWISRIYRRRDALMARGVPLSAIVDYEEPGKKERLKAPPKYPARKFSEAEEQQVARLWLEGKTDKQIAASLFQRSDGSVRGAVWRMQKRGVLPNREEVQSEKKEVA